MPARVPALIRDTRVWFRDAGPPRLPGMDFDDAVRGEMAQGREPCWPPLVDLVGEELAATFMWMFEVELDDGRPVHAYKHVFTRRYLHLAEDGTAFTYRPEHWYDPIEPALLLRLVLEPWWTDLGADPEDEALAKAVIERVEAGDDGAFAKAQ